MLEVHVLHGRDNAENFNCVTHSSGLQILLWHLDNQFYVWLYGFRVPSSHENGATVPGGCYAKVCEPLERAHYCDIFSNPDQMNGSFGFSLGVGMDLQHHYTADAVLQSCDWNWSGLNYSFSFFLSWLIECVFEWDFKEGKNDPMNWTMQESRLRSPFERTLRVADNGSGDASCHWRTTHCVPMQERELE